MSIETPPPTRPPWPPPGVGAGILSEAAQRRLDRAGPEPLRPPPPGDPGAVARWRAAIHGAWLAGDPPADACGHDEVELGGVRCLRTAPAGGPLVVYLHGGGYALGSPEVALPITERLARRVEVVSVDYRLAPEHPCPAGIDDGRAVIDALREAAPDRPFVLAGDSAGANLALALALALRAAPDVAVAGLVLFSPHLDHGSVPRPRRHHLSDVDDVGAAWLRAAYCGPHDPEDPLVSPLRAPLAGLPPVLVQVGSDDTSLGHAVALARLARIEGVRVTLDVWSGLWHTWHYHRDLPEADRALAEAAQFAAAPGEGPDIS